MTSFDAKSAADLPQLDPASFAIPSATQLQHPQPSRMRHDFYCSMDRCGHVLLVGLLTEEAARILTLMGGEVQDLQSEWLAFA